MRFLLLDSKKYITFALVISPRLGIMSFGWVVADIIKGVITRFVFGYLESGKFSYIQHIAAF